MAWTLSELVAEVATRIAALPAPKNGQVRAVPDERTVRYYGSIGLLDRPLAMRGRTALYGPRHVAQVVAIKRLQTMGRSLAEISQLWPTLDDATLTRMSGVVLESRRSARGAFWKGASDAPRKEEDEMQIAAGDHVELPRAIVVSGGGPTRGAVMPAPDAAPIEVRIELAPHVVLSLAIADDGVALSPADVRAIRAAAAPLVAELAARRLAAQSKGEKP